MSLTLGQIAEIAGARLPDPAPTSDPNICHAASLTEAGPEDVAFFRSGMRREALQQTRAGAVLLNPSAMADCPTVGLACSDPTLGMARVLQALYPEPEVEHRIHSTACIDRAARLHEPVSIGAGCLVGAGSSIGAGTTLEAYCVIDANVEIGADCYLHPRVTLHANTRIGARNEIWSGTVIGSDGFGYAQEERRWNKLKHRGGVRVGDDCEIGANTTIDRGMFDDTVIEDGVKIDNQVQIAHNVHIGAHSAIAGCAGIAGSAWIGRFCQIGGGAGVQGHVKLSDGVIITGMSKANHTLPKPGIYSSGTAIQENAEWLRNIARLKKLDQIVRALNESDKT